MNTRPEPDPARIAKTLHDYVVEMDTWAPDMAETFMTFGSRADLHTYRAHMSPAQLAEMARADAIALEAYPRHLGEEDPYHDIADLGEIVAIIEAERAEPQQPGNDEGSRE